MIGIKINGEFIDLFPDTRIDLTLNNPIFADDDIIPGSYTLPFDIPGGEVSPANARILGNPDVVEGRTGRLVFDDVYLFFDGLQYKKGQIIINPVSGKLYKGNFNFGLRTIADDFKNKSIRDLIDEDFELTTETYSRKVYAISSDSPMKLKVQGTVFEGATLSDLVDQINAGDDDPAVTATYHATGSTPKGASGPYIDITLTSNADDPEYNLHVDSADTSTAERSKWYIEVADISTYIDDIKATVEAYIDASPPDNKVRFPMVYNDGLYDEYKLGAGQVPKQGRKWVNYAPDGTLRTNDPNYGADNNKPFQVYNYTNLQPFVPLKYVFDAIANYFDISYEGDFFDDPYYAEAIFVNSYVVDKQIPYIGSYEYLYWMPSFNLRDLVPDMSVETLFKELQKKLNLAIRYNEDTGRVRIVKRQPLMQAGFYVDLSDSAGPVDGVDDVRNSGIRIESQVDKNDLFSAVDFYQFNLQYDLLIPCQFSQLAADHTEGTTVFLYMRQKAFSDFLPRLAFYKGIQAPAGYAKASYLGWNLHLGGLAGFVETDYKEYLEWLLVRKKVTMPMDIPFRILKAIDWEKKYRVDRVNYFFKTITASLTMQGVEVSKVELYSL